jgi:hypothetical protein
LTTVGATVKENYSLPFEATKIMMFSLKVVLVYNATQSTNEYFYGEVVGATKYVIFVKMPVESEYFAVNFCC